VNPHVIAFGSEYLRIVALNFVGPNCITTSKHLPRIGNTWPPLLSSMTRLFLFVLPALLVARTPGFRNQTCLVSVVGSQLIQAGINLLLLRRELPQELNFESSKPCSRRRDRDVRFTFSANSSSVSTSRSTRRPLNNSVHKLPARPRS